MCTQCVSNPPYFDETHCLDRYEGVLQDALHQLKYQKRLAYAHGLAAVWNHIMTSQLDVSHSAYLMPVPLSTQKLALRGFNQSWEIARRIECTHIEKLPHALQRDHYQSSQAGGRLSSRRAAIQGMFYVDNNYIELLQNQNVIIFDDVMTSGATLNEIARILKDNGVSRVINWVLLRTAKTAHV